LSGCPFLKIVIGSPFFPSLDQSLLIDVVVLEVEPNLKLLPNLPSYIISPSNGISGWILDLSINVFWDAFVGLPKFISVELSVTLRNVPPSD
jgi:hypothetical protein